MVLNDISKGRIIEISSFGMTHRDIARKVGCGKSTVTDFLKKYKETGETVHQSGSGRKRKTTKREDRRIVQAALKNRRISTDGIKAETGNTNISGKTIIRCLHECKNLDSHWAIKKPLLSKINIARRF
ncbi:uncharacterized protein LOC101237861 [Hydra vulgaris]|uniref:uncharacterized protein LOC101237861 n=1 Tax=Hydra vulgaris TaxID=6087 RepID=UPI0002B43876|nr:uncharacterized protein LOC101237861 [Hydra vulgaris]